MSRIILVIFIWFVPRKGSRLVTMSFCITPDHGISSELPQKTPVAITVTLIKHHRLLYYITSVVYVADVLPTPPLVKNDSRLVPSRPKATTPVTSADPRIGLQTVTVLVRAFALRAVVAVLVLALRLSFAPGGIRANTSIVLHLASIFARLGHIRLAVPRAFSGVLVGVQLERIFGEGGE